MQKFNSEYSMNQKRDTNIENKRLDTSKKSIFNASNEIFSLKEALIFAEEDRDLHSDISCVSTLENEIKEKEVIVHNMKMHINIQHELKKRNQNIRNILNMIFDSKIELLASQTGEIEGNHLVLKEMRRSNFKIICEKNLNLIQKFIRLILRLKYGIKGCNQCKNKKINCKCKWTI